MSRDLSAAAEVPASALPEVLQRHMDPSGLTCEVEGLRLRIYRELTPPSLLKAGALRLFHVGVSIQGVGDGQAERERLMYVGEGAQSDTARVLSRALELIDADVVEGVLPQIVDYLQIGRDGILLTSEHLTGTEALDSPGIWRALDLEVATDMLVWITSAVRWFHNQGLALGGLRLEQLRINPAQRRVALAHFGSLVQLLPLNEVQATIERQRDIASIGRLLFEAATSSDSGRAKGIFARVLDDAQVLVDAGLARPGLSQVLVGTMVAEAPFGYTSADELLHGLLQLQAELAPSLTYHTAMLSTAGNFPLRRTDQDSCGFTETCVIYHGQTRHLGFYCVADGVGGEEHGERASQASVFASLQGFHQAVGAYDFESLKLNASVVARTVVKLAAQHLAIVGEADPGENRGATTFTGAVIAGDRLGIGHVGDSRAYLLRDAALTPLTRDHNLSNVKEALRLMTGKDPVDAHGDERRISRYLGTSAETPMSWVDAFDPALVPHLATPPPRPQDDERGELDRDADLGDDLLLEHTRLPHGALDQPRPGQLDLEAEALCATIQLCAGDKLILMSDGLYGELDDDTIAAALNAASDPQVAVRELARLALRDLAMDNISVVVVEVAHKDSNLTMSR